MTGAEELTITQKAGRSTLYGLLVPMRDGVALALDVVLPSKDGPHPVVLIRTMYDKVAIREAMPAPDRGIPYDGTFLDRLLNAGFALAVQDVRGRFDSDGEWHPYMHERRDGFDTVEWIEQQPWCDGNIGMIGRSYVAYTQWMAAADKPKGLKAIVPISPQADLYNGYPIIGGAFLLAKGELGIKGGRHSFQIRDFMHNVMDGSEPYFKALPLASMFAEAGATEPPWWTEMMSHPDYDDYWKQGTYNDAWGSIEVPALNITGWYDLVLEGAVLNFEGMRNNAVAAAARDGQELIVGPWAHWVNVRRELEGIDYGPHAVIDLDSQVLGFFERWLTPASRSVTGKPVHVFVMGLNEWWEADDWPLPETEPTGLFLRGDGTGNPFDTSGGELSFDAPTESEPDDVYTYDPQDPVVSSWSMHGGAVDDRDIATRPDVLTYASAPLLDDFDVVGPVSLRLFASSSARDTDWHVRLIDFFEDGSWRFISHGVLRARYRNSFDQPELLEPGEFYEFVISMTSTANRFLRGHRIALEIMSSWFPRFERNMNSGAANNLRDADAQPATQTVRHTNVSPSQLVLPVIRSGLYKPVDFAQQHSRSSDGV